MLTCMDLVAVFQNEKVDLLFLTAVGAGGEHAGLIGTGPARFERARPPPTVALVYDRYTKAWRAMNCTHATQETATWA